MKKESVNATNDAVKPRKRRSHSKNFDTVCHVFRSNLLGLFGQDKQASTDGQLARVFDVNEKTISSWKQGVQLPRAETLLLIADRYNVSIDWLLGKKQSPPKPLTYSAAFLRLQSMQSLIGDITFTDPFLDFMFKTYKEVGEKPYVSKQMVDTWYQKFLKDFDEPLIPKPIVKYIDPGLKIYSQLSDYESYVTCLSRMSHYARYGFSAPFIKWAIRDSGKENVFTEDEIALWTMEDAPYYPDKDGKELSYDMNSGIYGFTDETPDVDQKDMCIPDEPPFD